MAHIPKYMRWNARRKRGTRFDPRQLHLKIRLRGPKGATRERILSVLDEAVATGTLPRGWTLHYIDWEKGVTGQAGNGGRLTDDLQAALEEFYGAISHPNSDVKVARAQD